MADYGDLLVVGASGTPRDTNGSTLDAIPFLIEIVTTSNCPIIDIHGRRDVRLEDSHISELVGAILVNNGTVTALSLKFHRMTDVGALDVLRIVEVSIDDI